MKKLILGIALLVATVTTAQKGSILVGGNIEFASEKIGDSKSTNFEFSPKIGYQLNDKWTTGIEGAIANVKVGNDKADMYRIGAFTRYSLPLSNLFAVYADLGAGYQTASVNDAKGLYANVVPALFINMKNGFGLNFSIGGINYDNLDGKDSPREERFGFNFGKTFNVGISKNFGL